MERTEHLDTPVRLVPLVCLDSPDLPVLTERRESLHSDCLELLERRETLATLEETDFPALQDVTATQDRREIVEMPDFPDLVDLPERSVWQATPESAASVPRETPETSDRRVPRVSVVLASPA